MSRVDKRLTSNSYTVFLKELLSTAIPGQVPRQAPRLSTIILESLANIVSNPSVLFFFRVLMVLLQCLGTLRFSDHRGLEPGGNFKITGNKLGMTNPCHSERCLSTDVGGPDWLSIGWSLLNGQANLARDYLVPQPSEIYRGFKSSELRYDTSEERLFNCRVAQF